jgi:hypothetical protein
MPHGRSRKTMKAIASAAGLMILLNACAPQATYPPVETTAKLARPTFEPVPTVLAVAIRYVQENCTKDMDLAINLPEGVPAEAYDMVFEKLGGGRPMTMTGEAAIHVKEVRTRNFNAQVDVIYPRPEGFNQLATITMKRTILENYRVERIRPWQLRDVAVLPPNYVAPPVAQEIEPQPEVYATDAMGSDDSSVAASPTDHIEPQK